MSYKSSSGPYFCFSTLNEEGSIVSVRDTLAPLRSSMSMNLSLDHLRGWNLVRDAERGLQGRVKRQWGLFPDPNLTEALLSYRLVYGLKRIKKLRNTADLSEEWQPFSSCLFPKYCILRTRFYPDLVTSFHSSAEWDCRKNNVSITHSLFVVTQGGLHSGSKRWRATSPDYKCFRTVLACLRYKAGQ